MRRLESFLNLYQEAATMAFLALMVALFTWVGAYADFPYAKPVGAMLTILFVIVASIGIPQERARKYVLIGLTAETLVILFAR